VRGQREAHAPRETPKLAIPPELPITGTDNK
jgi:hypothetical protein